MVEPAVQAVLDHYALTEGIVRHVQPLANAGGWSGSRIWRVTLDEGAIGNALAGIPGLAAERQLAARGLPQKAVPPGDLCLRRWPQEHPAQKRLRLIHAVLELVANELPIVAYPLRAKTGATAVEQDGHL